MKISPDFHDGQEINTPFGVGRIDRIIWEQHAYRVTIGSKVAAFTWDDKRISLAVPMTEDPDADAQAKPMPSCVCGTKVSDLQPTNRFVIEADNTGALPQIYCWTCAQKTLADRKKEAAIEALCRQLCGVDGHDPDMLFFREELYRLNLPGGQAFAVPKYSEYSAPIWTAYEPYARKIINSEKAQQLEASA